MAQVDLDLELFRFPEMGRPAFPGDRTGGFEQGRRRGREGNSQLRSAYSVLGLFTSQWPSAAENGFGFMHKETEAQGDQAHVLDS